MTSDSDEIDEILAEEDNHPPLSDTFVQATVNQIMETLPPSVYVYLENKYYVAGEKVEGKVVLDLPREFLDASVNLNFVGFEGVEVFNSNIPVSQMGRQIFSHESILIKPEHFNPGRHIFPFSYKLPAHCPPTFSYSGQDTLNNYIKAMVSYNLFCKLLYNNEELTNTTEICIRAKESRTSKKEESQIIENVQGICCISKGFSSFTLQLNNIEPIIVNQTVNYKLLPDNANCSVPINQVTAEVVLEMEFQGKEKNYVVNEVLSSIPRITWIAAFSSQVYEKDFEFKSEVKLPGGDKNVASIDTGLIRVKYFVQVKIMYDIALRKQQAVVRLPFHVNPLGVLCKDVPTLPLQWNSSVREEFKIILD